MVENRSRRSPLVHMCASIGVSGIARRANRLRRCAIARQHARSLCAATGTVAPPFIDGRKSVASLAHTNMRANPEGAEILRSGKQPAPSRHRSRLLSQTVCRLAQAPPTRSSMVENRSRRAPTPICVQRPRGAEILRSGNSLPRRAIALRHFPRPCAGSRKHRRPGLSMVENRSRRAPTPICVQIPRGPKSLGPVTACPVAPSLSDTSPDHAPARASTADPVYRWSRIGRVARPRQYACKTRGGRNPEVR